MAVSLLTAVLLAGGAVSAEPARAAARPFDAGETLHYQVRVGQGKPSGRGRLSVEAADSVRGEPVVLLSFDVDTKIGFFSVEHQSRSWLSRDRMAALRFEVDEDAPLNSLKDQFEIDPDSRQWSGRRSKGRAPTVEPLDELSFIYFLRTLPLEANERHRLDRHFDPRRNPVDIRVIGREEVRVPAGEFPVVIVEMNVRDPARLGGQGKLRVFLSDDARRLPVRIESSVPVFGRLVLELLPNEPPNQGGVSP